MKVDYAFGVVELDADEVKALDGVPGAVTEEDFPEESKGRDVFRAADDLSDTICRKVVLYDQNGTELGSYDHETGFAANG